MNRKMSVSWNTTFNETRTSTEGFSNIETTISLENDDTGVLWLRLTSDDNDDFIRRIHEEDIVKLSRFFYDASDFVKRDL